MKFDIYIWLKINIILMDLLKRCGQASKGIYIYIYINKITELKQDIYNMKIPSKVILLLYMNTPL